MAKKKPTSDPKAETTARIKRTEAYAERVRLMFAATVNQILALNKTLPKLQPGEMFSFDSQSLKKQNEVEKLLRQLHSVATMAIQQGITLEWSQANAAADALVKSVFGQAVLSTPEFKAWGARNGAAMQAFISRSEKGLNLSDRVWKAVRQLRDEMEVAITVSVGEGQSAQKISQSVRKYLNDPDLMFRRFRYKAGEEPILDEDGKEIGKKIIWGKKWKKRIKKPDGTYGWIDYDRDSYKTGAGVYKSSAKNAMRVARTETNIAYRRADHERWQAMDFVLGQRVSMSKNHPKKDICDKLAGDYPKDFVFDGWHPQCFCFVTPITIPPEETAKLTEMMLNGEDWKSELARLKRGREITSYPDNFKQWVTDNADNIQAARERGTEPYFIRNNGAAIDNIINPPKALTEKTNTTRTPQEIAKERHAARTTEDVEKIQSEWNRRRLWNANDGIENLDIFFDKGYQEFVKVLEDDIALGDHQTFEHDFAEMKRIIAEARKVEYLNTEKLMNTPPFKKNNDELEATFGKRGEAMPFRPANQLRGNPHYAESEAYRVNCQTCVVANELRRRGFDLEALANTKGSALEALSYHTESAWVDSNGNIPKSNISGLRKIKRKRWDGTEYEAWEKTCKNRKQMVSALEAAITEDGRYHIKWTWAKRNCGHIITVERIKGEYRYYDPQNGKVITDFVGYINGIKTAGGIRWLRVDTLRVNPDIAKKVLTKPTVKVKTDTAAKGGTSCVNTPLTDAQKQRRTEIRQITRTTIVDKPIMIPGINRAATISSGKIKEWLNQPHQHIIEKNESLLHLNDLISKGEYIGHGIDKHDPTVIAHLVRVKIAGDDSWVVIRELNDGSIRIHSISDNRSIVNEIIKKKP